MNVSRTVAQSIFALPNERAIRKDSPAATARRPPNGGASRCFGFLAEEVREILASLGVRSLNEIVGRSDLLAQVSRGSAYLDDLDLTPLLGQADPGDERR